ncbi:MAG: hypothetical protein J5483_01860 [Lachnospiraceae bacterium]|nr:hypothetical protein [Lachnospiraceae bacterium]
MKDSVRFKIDSITWNDLDMDEVYQRLDICRSSVGSEVLKQTLTELVFDEEILQNRSDKADFLRKDPNTAKQITKVFSDLGKTKKVSFLDYIFRLKEIKPAGNAVHFLLILLLLLSIAAIFLKPAIGIVALVVIVALNIILYFRFKAPIEPYFNCVKYLVSMVTAGEKTAKILNKEASPFSADAIRLTELVHTFSSVRRGSWLITNSVSGSLVDVIMDYVRMLFHVDLIRFHSMHKFCSEHEEEIRELYEILGGIETAVCISRFRESLPYYCLPTFHDKTQKTSFQAEEAYHPLVKDPVANSILTDRSVLLTGSNASGKSTFLKMIAVNQIFAQTIDTVLARKYDTTFYQVLSSMALKDNILGQESYFVVEIKSMKRIFDALSEEHPSMIFVDEVLRGTNTKERIAASTQILKKLSHENALCFAATHDIELTKLLENDMENYHFTEHISEETGDVLFDYQIRPGSAVSSNAILLLKAYGFPKDITDGALEMM